MDSTSADPNTWVGFAVLVWKDVWGYMATTGLGLAIGIFLPQLKVKNPLKKAPPSE